jgi:hypothetical protein
VGKLHKPVILWVIVAWTSDQFIIMYADAGPMEEMQPAGVYEQKMHMVISIISKSKFSSRTGI